MDRVSSVSKHRGGAQVFNILFKQLMLRQGLSETKVAEGASWLAGTYPDRWSSYPDMRGGVAPNTEKMAVLLTKLPEPSRTNLRAAAI